jgi:hypothetical protein
MAWYLTSRYAKVKELFSYACSITRFYTQSEHKIYTHISSTLQTKEKLRKTIEERDSVLESLGCRDVYDAQKWIEDVRNVA